MVFFIFYYFYLSFFVTFSSNYKPFVCANPFSFRKRKDVSSPKEKLRAQLSAPFVCADLSALADKDARETSFILTFIRRFNFCLAIIYVRDLPSVYD